MGKSTKLPAKTVEAALAKAEKRWEKDIDELKKRVLDAHAGVLQIKFDTGRIAIALEDKSKRAHERRYGKHTVQDLATALSSSPADVYNCQKFARFFSQKDVDRFKENQWPWRQITALVSTERAEDRERFMLEYEAGMHREYGDRFKEVVRDHEQSRRDSGKRKDMRGNRLPALTAAKQANTLLNQAVSKVLPQFIDGVRQYVKIAPALDENRQQSVAEKIGDVKGQLPAMRKLLADAESAIKAAGI
jgi:hypothetical protein